MHKPNDRPRLLGDVSFAVLRSRHANGRLCRHVGGCVASSPRVGGRERHCSHSQKFMPHSAHTNGLTLVRCILPPPAPFFSRHPVILLSIEEESST